MLREWAAEGEEEEKQEEEEEGPSDHREDEDEEESFFGRNFEKTFFSSIDSQCII